MFSILVPTYNREDHVGDCLESILGQDHPSFEVVICDNASSDRTYDICREFADNDPRIRVYQNASNLGPVRNWRRCIEYSHGEYVKFVYSDDLLLPGALAAYSSAFDQYGDSAGLVVSPVLVGKSVSTAKRTYMSLSGALIPSEKFVEMVTLGRGPVSPGAVAMRRADALRHLRCDFPFAPSHDYCGHGAGPDVWMILAAADDYASIAVVPESLAYFRSHEGSLTMSKRTSMAVRAAYITVIAGYLRETGRHSLLGKYMTYRSLALLRHPGGLKDQVRHLVANGLRLRDFSPQYALEEVAFQLGRAFR